MRGLVALLFVLVSCQQNDNTNSPPNQRTTPNGAPMAWSEASRSQVCTPPGNEPMCVNGTFTVHGNGHFVFKSDTLPHKEGMLSAGDFKALDTLLKNVSDGELTRDMTCMEVISIPENGGMQLTFTKTQGEPVVLKEFGRNGGCYRIEQARADELDDLLNVLTKRYLGYEP
ncbi:MAG TPA: hypothetical protein VFV50_04485 [Bdellovibrionales bacterium]|nr:hypothetical protein [Bdellovibrionales bacterium]